MKYYIGNIAYWQHRFGCRCRKYPGTSKWIIWKKMKLHNV